ncbi:MAG: efflux RND transporter periplasmic adaptor subunit [Proteobacteria bacterium]|nr:efflux RND transporter periplasmic adaptor subunit [Pseudomonadota bacterium]
MHRFHPSCRIRPTLAATVVIWATACSPQPAHAPTAPVPVSLATVTRGPVPERIAAVGTVEAINAIAVKSLVDGQLLDSDIHDGNSVRKGQLLFRIDPRPAQAALAQAHAALARDAAARDLAQAQVNRYRPIAAQHYISADQMQQYATALEAAAASVKVDQANIAATNLTLGYTDIRAPIDGRAGRILVQPGNLVKANDINPLLTINQIAPIYVSFAIPGDEVTRVRAAQAKGTLAVRASGDRLQGPASGSLAFIDNAVDPATNTVKLRARFANADERLWPGQFVQIALDVGRDADALSVPDAAVKSGANGSYVFVVADGIAHQRAVTVARSVDGRSLLVAGVRAGETVVTDGQSRLTEGAKVAVVDADAAAAPRADASGSAP